MNELNSESVKAGVRKVRKTNTMFNKAALVAGVKINDKGLSAVNEVGKFITNDAMRTVILILLRTGWIFGKCVILLKFIFNQFICLFICNDLGI